MNIEDIKKIIPNSKDWKYCQQITFGWSGEQKYKIIDNISSQLLLRILSKEQYSKQQDGIAFLERCGKNIDNIPHILDQGETLDGNNYYLLLNFIPGQDGMKVINTFSHNDQYMLGTQMGETIKKLHNLSSPTLDHNYHKNILQKIELYSSYYNTNKDKYTFISNIEENLSKLTNIIHNRPVVMIHNDFHLGNMVIDGNTISLIDFNRTELGDPIKEFDAIAWSATNSIPFATGVLDAYLQGENIANFFEILRPYISLWQIQMLSFIENENEEEKQTVLNLIKFTQSWFTDNKNIPNWYIQNSRILNQ